MSRFFFSIFLGFSFSLPLFAAEKNIESLVHELAEPLVGTNKPVFGCVIGVVNGEQIHRFPFGRLEEESDRLPNEKTVYEIASVTKLLTGLLLADMVVRGEVKLDDLLADLLPEGTALPQKGERPITLRDLATHRSGLPRLAPNFWETANRTPGNPYTLFTREKVFESLADWKPEYEPQERYEYSNYGYAILGNILAAQKGKTYEELLGERILRPLGMAETKTVLDEPLQKRLAPPYDADGKRCLNWDLSTGFAPGGGLRSTLDDMLKFATASTGNFKRLEEEFGLPSDPSQWEMLDKAFTLAQTPQAEGVRERCPIGLGWNYHADQKFYWHNGQTGGYFSMFLLDRDKQIAIVILSNSFNNAPDSLAVKILENIRRFTPDP